MHITTHSYGIQLSTEEYSNKHTFTKLICINRPMPQTLCNTNAPITVSFYSNIAARHKYAEY